MALMHLQIFFMTKQVFPPFIDFKRLRSPALFVLKVAVIYVLWRFIKFQGETKPEFLWGYWSKTYEWMCLSLASSVSFIIDIMGYNYFHAGRVVIIEGSRGMSIEDLCAGIPAMVLFSGIIFSYGNNNKARLWFIPMGLVFIYAVNVFRLTCFVLIQKHCPQYFKFAHSYLYVVATYGLIFLMMIYWMNKLAFKKK
jgi:exosortase/archaeosortase family protein